jgi:hypothetical protein
MLYFSEIITSFLGIPQNTVIRNNRDGMTQVAIFSADSESRDRRKLRPTGTIRVGSDEHLRLFCLELLETHDPYRPAILDWPTLSPEALGRVTSLPIWNMAVQKEGFASVSVKAFADTVRDPLLRQAIDLDASEEYRHKEVLSHLVAAYGIELEAEPPYPTPKDPEWGWLAIGYGECIDSFFAFGLFEAARRTGFFPAALIDTFDPVMQEEGRHILFFVNWVAWSRRNMPWWRRPWFELKLAAVWLHLIWERVGMARGLGTDKSANDLNFTATRAAAVGTALQPREIIELCLAENDRRLERYDARLLRPRLVPLAARLALRFMKRRQ